MRVNDSKPSQFRKNGRVNNRISEVFLFSNPTKACECIRVHLCALAFPVYCRSQVTTDRE